MIDGSGTSGEILQGVTKVKFLNVVQRGKLTCGGIQYIVIPSLVPRQASPRGQGDLLLVSISMLNSPSPEAPQSHHGQFLRRKILPPIYITCI
jgi:hypothetical protein